MEYDPPPPRNLSVKKLRALFDESKPVHECECLEDHADLRNEYEYFSHIMVFPWHRLIPK